MTNRKGLIINDNTEMINAFYSINERIARNIGKLLKFKNK